MPNIPKMISNISNRNFMEEFDNEQAMTEIQNQLEKENLEYTINHKMETDGFSNHVLFYKLPGDKLFRECHFALRIHVNV